MLNAQCTRVSCHRQSYSSDSNPCTAQALLLLLEYDTRAGARIRVDHFLSILLRRPKHKFQKHLKVSTHILILIQWKNHCWHARIRIGRNEGKKE